MVSPKGAYTRYYFTRYPKGTEKKILGSHRDGKLLPEYILFRDSPRDAKIGYSGLPAGEYTLCAIVIKQGGTTGYITGMVSKDFSITEGEKTELQLTEGDIKKEKLPSFLAD